MNKKIEELIEEKRRELVDSIIQYGVASAQVLKISEELDDIINSYHSAVHEQ